MSKQAQVTLRLTDILPHRSPLALALVDLVAMDRAHHRQLTLWTGRMKRQFDLLFAILALAFFAPLLIGIAILIKLTSCGPVLFTQTRVGRSGKLFTIYKFRTMTEGADLLGCRSQANDPRVSATGRFLRATKLDELPQLWNIIAGEMSLVGPRPLSLAETREIIAAGLCPFYPGLIPQVVPGLTGLEQISRTRKLGYRERFAFNKRYEENPSWTQDFAILLRTLLMHKAAPAAALATGLIALTCSVCLALYCC